MSIKTQSHPKNAGGFIRFVALCIICFALVNTIALAQQPEKPLAKINWLLGKWMQGGRKNTLYEHWRYVNDSTFQSRSYLVMTPGDTVELETVQITSRKGQLFYIATVNGQNNGQAVPFKIISVSGNEFISSNPKHDYPQRVAYKLESPGNLYAWIDGTEKGKYSKQEFRMKKVE